MSEGVLEAELAWLIRADVPAVERAIQRQHDRDSRDAHDFDSTMTSVAQLVVLLSAFAEPDRQEWLRANSPNQHTRRDRLLRGGMSAVATELSEHMADQGSYFQGFDTLTP